MRRFASWAAAGCTTALVLVACGSKPEAREPSLTTPVEPSAIELGVAHDLALRMGVGLPMSLELVAAPDHVVGACEVAFDLWDEIYVTTRAAQELARARDRDRSLRACLVPAALAETTARRVIVREVAAAPRLGDAARDARVW